MSQKEQIAALEATVAQLQTMLGMGGQPEMPAGPAPDYIEHGSDGHLAFLGLIRVGVDDDTTGFTTFVSPETNKEYRLADELQATHHYQGMDPDKAVIQLLRSKISNFESGPPSPPVDAPPLQTMDVNLWTQ